MKGTYSGGMDSAEQGCGLMVVGGGIVLLIAVVLLVVWLL